MEVEDNVEEKNYVDHDVDHQERNVSDGFGAECGVEGHHDGGVEGEHEDEPVP